MNNNTDHTPEDDPIQEQLFKLRDDLARVGWKLTTLTLERDPSHGPPFESDALPTKE